MPITISIDNNSDGTWTNPDACTASYSPCSCPSTDACTGAYPCSIPGASTCARTSAGARPCARPCACTGTGAEACPRPRAGACPRASSYACPSASADAGPGLPEYERLRSDSVKEAAVTSWGHVGIEKWTELIVSGEACVEKGRKNEVDTNSWRWLWDCCGRAL